MKTYEPCEAERQAREEWAAQPAEERAGCFVDFGPGNPPRYQPVGDEHKKDVVPGIPNRHFRNCGVPPTLDERWPTQYFENDIGEQGVMQFDMDEGVCRVWMADCGWDNEIRVYEIKGRLVVAYYPPYSGEELDRKREGLSETAARWEQSHRHCCDQIFGKLSDEEYFVVARCVVLRQCEYDAIVRFYETNLKAYERQKQKHRRQAERDIARLEAKLRRLEARFEARSQEEHQQKVNERRESEEIKALREAIRVANRLIRGERDEQTPQPSDP